MLILSLSILVAWVAIGVANLCTEVNKGSYAVLWVCFIAQMIVNVLRQI